MYSPKKASVQSSVSIPPQATFLVLNEKVTLPVSLPPTLVHLSLNCSGIKRKKKEEKGRKRRTSKKKKEKERFSHGLRLPSSC